MINIILIFSTLIITELQAIYAFNGNSDSYFEKLDEFNSFIDKFDRNYNKSQPQYWYRYHIFEKNMNYIEKRNLECF